MKKTITLIVIILSIILLVSACGKQQENGEKAETEPKATAVPEGAAALPLKADKEASYFDTLVRLGLTEDGESGTTLNVEIADLTEDFSTGAEEGYILTVTKDRVNIKAQTERGVHYAILALSGLVTEGQYIEPIMVKDAPQVAIRGVIEGFYGEAWSDEFRLELMEHMGDMKMNSYIYAPKDDLKHRSQWRELYTESELSVLKALVDEAKANYVDFIYAISPGNDINLGSGYEKDFTILTNKCQQLYDIGVRHFAILLDDIPVLDAEGHAKLLNDFNTKFIKTHDGCGQMIAITPEYTDSFLTNYTNTIAGLLDKDITLMWTGPGVVCETITVKSLAKINEIYGSNVLIWWNYPVNDLQQEHLYLDACRGLSADLNTAISGLVSNPMNQGEASLIPLYTTADYLWNPENYDPDKSLSEAVNIIDPSLHDELVLLCDACGADSMNGWTSTSVLKDLLKKYSFDKFDESLNAQLIEACEKLATVGNIKNSKNTVFVEETSDWINKTEAYANMALTFFRMEKANKEGDANAVAKYIGEFASWSKISSQYDVLTSQDVLGPFVEQLPQRVNILAGIQEEVKCHEASGFTNLGTYSTYKISNMCDGDDSTYFWSNGAPGTGHVGIDLGEITTLDNIYILTGENGGDVFASAIIEYSTDKKNWTEIASGGFGEEIFLDNLGVEARYVRMRGTDKTSVTWVKIRAFEANTTRNPGSGAGEFAISTSFTTYQTYNVENVLDNDKNTYFWSARSVESGDYVQIDLGILSEISSIYLNTGVGGHTADCMPAADLLVSADGYRWETVASGVKQGPNTYDGLTIRGRYIKFVATKAGANWFTMSDFDVTYSPVTDSRVTSDSSATAVELARVCDENAVTLLYINDPGKSLEFSLSGAETVRIIAPSTGEGTVCELIDESGNKFSSVNLENNTIIDCRGGAKLVIRFGTGEIAIAEIIA